MARKHGWELPPDPHQVGAIILFAILATGCYVLFFPFVEDRPTRFALIAAYGLVIATTVVLNIITSWTDPSDAGIRLKITTGEFYCSLCQVNVDKRSKHCKTCDRCTEGFDHHCKWLNNCIGKRNYKPFFALVAFTLTMLVFELAVGIYLFAHSFYAKKETARIVNSTYHGYVNYIGWQVAMAAFILVICAAIFMLGELFSFHVVLVYKGMTTYDYIVFQRDQRIQKEAAATEEGRAGKPLPKQSFCKPKRIHDENSAQAAARKKKAKVGINPCAACATPTPAAVAAKAQNSAAVQDKLGRETADEMASDRATIGTANTYVPVASGTISTPRAAVLTTTSNSRMGSLELSKRQTDSTSLEKKNAFLSPNNGAACVEMVQEAAAPADIPGVDGSCPSCGPAPTQPPLGAAHQHDPSQNSPAYEHPMHSPEVPHSQPPESPYANPASPSRLQALDTASPPAWRSGFGSDLSPRGHLTAGKLPPISPRLPQGMQLLPDQSDMHHAHHAP